MSDITELNIKTHPSPNGCNFYVIRKKRFCRLLAKKNDKYCAEHSMLNAHTNCDNRRVICPLDNKHTCYVNKLKKHLKICNARPGEPLPYISIGINAGVAEKYENNNETARSINDKDISTILSVIAKVNKIYEDYVKDNVTELICKSDFVEEEIRKPEYGPRTQKHLKQVSSLIGILKEYKLFNPDTCYIELGAGKGHLSYWIYKAIEQIENTRLLLIERASHRHKFDNKLDKDNGRVCRIRADIADLVLNKTDVIEKCKYVVGIAKHLCGEATDLALRCLINCSENGRRVLGVTLAFCCHHKCYWGSYVGKTFFKMVDLSEEDFDVMCGMVSWATCGSGKNRDWIPEDSTNNYEKNFNNRYENIGLTKKDKEEIGKKCKAIINWGRKMYLEENGYRCHLHLYTKESITLENVCLVAHFVQ